MKTKEFFAVCKNPKQVAEITLQPIDRFDLDGSIIFSDILVIPQVRAFYSPPMCPLSFESG